MIQGSPPLNNWHGATLTSDRTGLRVVAIVEDKRTQRLLHRLLPVLGFRTLRWEVAPAGVGAAERWVLEKAVDEIKALRARPHQRLGLIVVRDGDNHGVATRKREVNARLADKDWPVRQPGERIVLLVPTWSVETWLLHLLGEPDVDESPRSVGGQTWKERYEHRFQKTEGDAAKRAAAGWSARRPGLASLDDAALELERLDE